MLLSLHLMGRHTLELLLLSLLVLLLKAVKLVVLQQETLLDHRLVRLGEEVVLFDIVLVSDHFSHIPLQIVALDNFLPWLLRWL